MDFWTAITFQTAYGLSAISTAILTDCLNEAQADIAAYTTTTAYAAALGGGAGQYKFKRVMAELALFYLDRRPGIAPQRVKSSSKEYSGVKKFKQTYQEMNGAESWSSGWILGQLIAYKVAITFESVDSWGTGRFIAPRLTIEEEEES